jgi:hypothetical protein
VRAGGGGTQAALSDLVVKKRLRALREPIALFDEDEGARYARYLLVADRLRDTHDADHELRAGQLINERQLHERRQNDAFARDDAHAHDSLAAATGAAGGSGGGGADGHATSVNAADTAAAGASGGGGSGSGGGSGGTAKSRGDGVIGEIDALLIAAGAPPAGVSASGAVGGAAGAADKQAKGKDAATGAAGAGITSAAPVSASPVSAAAQHLDERAVRVLRTMGTLLKEWAQELDERTEEVRAELCRPSGHLMI